MLLRFGGDVTVDNSSSGINSFHIAAQGDQPKILHFLIQHKFYKIEAKDANSCTALHWACYSGAYQSVRYLLAMGANPNAISDGNSSPLHYAVRYLDESRDVRCINKLLHYGVDPHIQVIQSYRVMYVG